MVYLSIIKKRDMKKRKIEVGVFFAVVLGFITLTGVLVYNVLFNGLVICI